jgi:hypothetical protein
MVRDVVIELSKIENWSTPEVWYGQIMPKIAGGANLDFTGVATLQRASVENLLKSLGSFASDETSLRGRLGVHTMNEEVQLAILPIFNLKILREEKQENITNNPFEQLDTIQATYKECRNLCQPE